MAKKAEAKRWAEWTTVLPREKPRLRRDAELNTQSYRRDFVACEGARTVRVVEVRRGEVVVDVEALVEAVLERLHKLPYITDGDVLREVLRKVGVR